MHLRLKQYTGENFSNAISFTVRKNYVCITSPGNIVFLFRVISCIVLYAIGTIRPFLTAPYEYHTT